MVRVAAVGEPIALGVPVSCRAGDTARTARRPTRRAGPCGASAGSAIDGMVSSIHGSSREAAVLRGVERALDAVDVAAPAGCVRTARPPARRRAERVETGEARQRRDRVVDLRQRAVRADVLDAPDELRVEMHRIEQAEQRALRIGVRDDGARGDALSPDASVTPVAAPSARHRSARTSAPVRISTPA